jgi:hypothetical protein
MFMDAPGPERRQRAQSGTAIRPLLITRKLSVARSSVGRPSTRKRAPSSETHVTVPRSPSGHSMMSSGASLGMDEVICLTPPFRVPPIKNAGLVTAGIDTCHVHQSPDLRGGLAMSATSRKYAAGFSSHNCLIACRPCFSRRQTSRRYMRPSERRAAATGTTTSTLHKTTTRIAQDRPLGWCRDGAILCRSAGWNVPPDPGLARYHQCSLNLHDGLHRSRYDQDPLAQR